MKKTIRIFNVLFILLCSTPPLCHAFEVETHKVINEYIAQGTINGFSLNDYLKNNLGFQKGVEETFTLGESKMVFAWLGKGGKKEDVPEILRNKNHFHDPLSNKGFGGLMGGLIFSGESSIIWSQKPIATQSPGGYYSWFDTRDYFHKALTSTTKDERGRYYAETFRGIGQLMHLVHDASVPSHTRNEFHAGYHYEGFVSYYQNQDKVAGNNYEGKFSSLLASPVSFDQSLLNISSPLASIPFANIFDSEKYTVTNPDPLVTLGNNIGLAEYTNANFFGDMTIFQKYPHPAKENTNAVLREKEAEDGVLDKVYYIQGYQSDSLSAYSYFANLDISGSPEGWKYNLDDDVYEDYATLLLPRAVGYSAGLLNYFFRGKIDIIIDPNNSSRYIIKNLSNENMFGAFSLYYDDTNNNRYLVASWGNLAINANSQSSSVTFTSPSSPAPKEKGKYILVFQGTFGNEIGAVMGKVVEGLCAGQWGLIDYCWGNTGDCYNHIAYRDIIDGFIYEVAWCIKGISSSCDFCNRYYCGACASPPANPTTCIWGCLGECENEGARNFDKCCATGWSKYAWQCI